MTAAGQIVAEGGRTFWRCPNAACRHKLAEIIGDRLVIRASGIQLSIGFRQPVDQTCPRCGTASCIHQEIAA